MLQVSFFLFNIFSNYYKLPLAFDAFRAIHKSEFFSIAQITLDLLYSFLQQLEEERHKDRRQE